MTLWVRVKTGLVVTLLAGCGSPGHGPVAQRPDPDTPGAAVPATGPTQASGVQGGANIVAYVNGQPLGWSDLRPALVESSGGQVVAELVLGRMVDRSLSERGQAVGPQQVEQERQLLAKTLHDDPDQAQRLLQQLRDGRGLGEYRFGRFLIRQAGLRMLVQDQVQLSEAAVRQAYELEHGRRYESRLIVVPSLAVAADLARRVRSGESFIDLAIAHSTDRSRVQGGMLGPISPVDPTYPQAIRTTLAGLEEGQVSDPVVLDDGFALLRLERILEGDGIEFERVEAGLRDRVRRRVEQMLMQQRAGAMLSEADVIILEPRLQEAWRLHRAQLRDGVRP